MIFVFGSNLAGRHGRGAAKHAMQHHGAKYGQGFGRQGNSYAIPTKDEKLNVLPLWRIGEYCRQFLLYARTHPELQFQLTAVGCGLAGYAPEEIAPLFREATDNIELPPEFIAALAHSTHPPADLPDSL